MILYHESIYEQTVIRPRSKKTVISYDFESNIKKHPCVKVSTFRQVVNNKYINNKSNFKNPLFRNDVIRNKYI